MSFIGSTALCSCQAAYEGMEVRSIFLLPTSAHCQGLAADVSTPPPSYPMFDDFDLI